MQAKGENKWLREDFWDLAKHSGDTSKEFSSTLAASPRALPSVSVILLCFGDVVTVFPLTLLVQF